MKIKFEKFYFLVYSKSIVKIIGKAIGLSDPLAAAFYPFLFIRPDMKNDARYEELIRHETIHLHQQIELLLVLAELLFIIEYVYARYVKKLDARQSYYWTSMEQEAHRNAMNPNYLTERKVYATFKYLFDKKWLGRTEDHQLIVKDFS